MSIEPRISRIDYRSDVKALIVEVAWTADPDALKAAIERLPGVVSVEKNLACDEAKIVRAIKRALPRFENSN